LSALSQILIIDDDPGLLQALSEVLRLNLGHLEITTSNSSREALALAAATEFEAIISDIKMPGMDGLTLLRELKAVTPDTPILLMTAHDDRDHVVLALRGGAYDYIQKPIDTDYFVASLHRAIQMRQLSRQVKQQKQALENHAQTLERTVQEAVAHAWEAQRRLAFLASASTLLASSLDYEATLARVARLAVLFLADYCIVDSLEENGELRCAGVAHVDRSQESLARQVRAQYTGPTLPQYPGTRVSQEHQSQFLPALSLEVLEQWAVDPDHFEAIKKLNPGSMLIIPMEATDQTLGILTFVRTGSGREYQPDDLSLAEDLTRRAALAVENAQLYQEAQQALHVRDEFLSIAAHELKTPLTSLVGNVQLLQRRLVRNGQVGDRELHHLDNLVSQTHRLNRLIDSLLNLNRLEAGQLTIDQGELDLTRLVRRVIKEFQDTVETNKIEYLGNEEPALIAGDELRLEQVLQNLLYNAIKYSPGGGQITVALERDETLVTVRVIDSGIGIPPQALPLLFNRFYRVENNSARKIGGLGLGLYVVKEIISLHGGTIQVESIEDKGSTFILRFPIKTLSPLSA
jgi:signal transduction histidine kinase/DNA-binding NarL/FixJ family response regulator